MRPSQVCASVQRPEGITYHTGLPFASYVNHTAKSVRYCCSTAIPQPFCAAPPHHMSPTVRPLERSCGPNALREIDLRPLAPSMAYVSTAFEATVKSSEAWPTGAPTLKRAAS